MKYIYIIIISLFFIFCKSSNPTMINNNCVENSEFKEKFFSNIKYVEKNITEVQDEKFKNSLYFLSKYVHVSFDKMSNYANTYPIGVFEEDKKGWLEWYEKNKCNNIKLKEAPSIGYKE